MTRLEVKYLRDGELLYMEGEGSGPFENEEVLLDDLKDLSALHVLAITNAPIKIIRLVFEYDPAELTEDVFLDACRYCTSCEIIEYLKAQVAPEYYSPRKICEILKEIIATGSEMYDERIKILSTIFPEAMVYSYEDDDYSGCPLDIVLYGSYRSEDRDNFPDDLIEHVLQHVPSTIKGFNLPSTRITPGVKTLYKQILTILTRSKIETFRSHENCWDLDEFVGFFTMFLPATENLDTFKLSVPGKKSAQQDLFAVLPTDWMKSCRISKLSLRFGFGIESESPDFGILPWMVQMRQLKTLSMKVDDGQSADHDFCKAICQVLSLGRLESLFVTASEDDMSDGLFHPLLDSIATCPSLASFRLCGLKKGSLIDTYHDKMITVLKSNTSLEKMWIGSSKNWSHSSANDSTGKEKLIDYFMTLNTCRRGLARESASASDLVNVLVEAPTNNETAQKMLECTGKFPSEKHHFTVAQVLYGLLRESPGTWSANALGQDSTTPQVQGLKRKASSLTE